MRASSTESTDQCGAMLEMRTARARGEAHVREVGIRMGGQPGRVTLRQRDAMPPATVRTASAHSPVRAGFPASIPAQRPGEHLHRRGRRTGAGAGCEAGASSISTWALVPVKPKELTPARRRPAVGLPRSRLVHDAHRQRVPRDVRRRIVEVQALRQHLVLQRQHDLDQTCCPRCRFGVADVGLHRPHQQRAVRVA